MTLAQEIESLNHSIAKRNHFSQLILQRPALFKELFSFCKQTATPISCKAAWGLEFMCRQQLTAILPYLEELLSLLPLVYQDSAIRPIAKICEQLCISYYHHKDPELQNTLCLSHRERIAEHCFDWLITDQKVAAKAYSMIALYHLGTELKWIHPELKMILEKEYSTGSAAYKARARMVLGNIKKQRV